MGFKKAVLHTFLFIILPGMAVAQSKTTIEEDVMLKAMQDELHRSMKDLKLPDYDKPFFILYNIDRDFNYNLTVSMGGVIQESQFTTVTVNSHRLLVGDYSFNDESLEENNTSQRSARSLAMPIDSNDYLGIRRALWASADEVYRGASKSYAQHQETVKSGGKALANIPHRTFAKASAVRIIGTLAPYHFEIEKWRTIAKNLSVQIAADSLILRSFVYLVFTRGYNYITTSEGTVVRTPKMRVTLSFGGNGKTSDGQLFYILRQFSASSPDKLPNEKQLIEVIQNERRIVAAQMRGSMLEETYNGPVLFLGQNVAGVFESTLFGGGENLNYTNQIEKLSGIDYRRNNAALDKKIGKNVINEAITVKTKPNLTVFGGTELLGSFPIDSEGIVPVPLTLIESGVLKNMLNDRTLTSETQEANGYQASPGVVEVTVAMKNTDKELRDKLIAEAKKEGLEYGIVVRDAPSSSVILNVFKVYVADGREEQVRNVMPGNLSFKSFRKLLGASGEYRAYNITPRRNEELARGNGASYIVPTAILLGDFELRDFSLATLKEETYVKRP